MATPAMSPRAAFAQVPRTKAVVVTAAVTGLNTNAPTDTVELMSADAKGAILTRLTAIPRSTCSASSLLLYISKDGGTTKHLIDSETMPSQAVAAGAGIAETIFGSYSEARPLRLEGSDKLYVGSQVALPAGIVFKAEWSDF